MINRNYYVLAVGVAALMLGGCSGKSGHAVSETVHNVFTVNPSPAAGSGVTSLPATVEEARTISVGFKTAGQIERILVKEGQQVAAGQLIAVLDSADYALGVSQLREKVAQMTAENERRTKLHATGNMSDNEYEKAFSGLRQVRIQLRLEEKKLGYCRLTAPASGVVTKVNFENSEMVNTGTPVVELMDNSSLEAIVDLPVRMFADRGSFSEFTGTSPLLPGKVIPLQMLSLTLRADNSQLYRLRLGVPAGEGVTPGMNITVNIYSSRADSGAVSVPLGAVFEREGAEYVWLVNPADSVVSARRVTVSGTGEGGSVTVTSGLTVADAIVRAGVHHLVEGEKVNVLPSESVTNPGNAL